MRVIALLMLNALGAGLSVGALLTAHTGAEALMVSLLGLAISTVAVGLMFGSKPEVFG